MALERNEVLLAKREEELTNIIEDLELAIHVAELKAKAQREEVDRLVEEIKKFREEAGKNQKQDNDAARKKGIKRWKGAERETGQSLGRNGTDQTHYRLLK